MDKTFGVENSSNWPRLNSPRDIFYELSTIKQNIGNKLEFLGETSIHAGHYLKQFSAIFFV